MKYLTPPFLIDVRKERVLFKAVGSPVAFEAPLYIWTKDEIIVAVGDTIEAQLEIGTVKHKIFYADGSMMISDFKRAQAAIMYLMQTYGKVKFIKPFIIWNVPYEMSLDEVKKLEKLSEEALARESIILHDQNVPRDSDLGINANSPYPVIVKRQIKEKGELLKTAIIVVLCMAALIYFKLQ